MWNQWSAGPPPLPANSFVNSGTLIGPVQPNATAPNITPTQSIPSVQPMQTAMYSTSSGAPSYTPAQFAAMTPEQQYAVQQHWQQWQAYEQQYAQWHAQYGEQYKREMAAMHGAPTPTVPSYNAVAPPVTNAFSFPPPNVVNAYPKQQAPNQAPPPPPPNETSNLPGVKALPQIYDQPPPPPPPPQSEEKANSKNENLTQFQTPPPQPGSYNSAQFIQNQDIRWSQPPPNIQVQENRWNTPSSQFKSNSNPFNSQFSSNYQTETQYGNQINDDKVRDNGQRMDNRDRNKKENIGQFQDSAGLKNQPEISNNNNRKNFNSKRVSNYDNHNNSGSSWNQDNKTAGKQNVTAEKQHLTLNSETNSKTGNGSVDEKTFDEQFRLWEEQFENWKKENANHPDRTMYKQYEREFEKTRIRLLERREQMRRRKMQESQQKYQQNAPKEKLQKLVTTDIVEILSKENIVAIEARPGGEQLEIDGGGQNKPIKLNVEVKESGYNISEDCGVENNLFKNKEITDLFKSASGIPGLDLVEGKDEGNAGESKEIIDSKVIDLDLENDGIIETEQNSMNTSNKENPLKNDSNESSKRVQDSLACINDNSKKKIPSLLDIVVEKPHLSPRNKIDYKSPSRERSPVAVKSTKSDSRSRSISRDRDALLSPGQRSTSQLSTISQGQKFLSNPPERHNEQSAHQSIENRRLQDQGDLPQNALEIAKALQDPNVMQLLSVALAQAQQTEGPNQCSGSQQSQLLQQLQQLHQLQPLIQMQQERNRLTQIWNNQQPQRPPSWQNQNNNSFNMDPSNSSDQNRSPWNSNPFNRNIDQKQIRSGIGSGNESDNNDVQQRNVRNPFRRSIGTFENDNNSGRNQSFGSNLSHGSLEGAFAQQHRGNNYSGAGRFENNRTHSNFGMSLGFRNNQNNFGDRGCNDEFYRPAQVFEYQNRSRADAIVPPTKVVDYGHRPSPVISTNSFNRDNCEFVPVKTIDYGHASSSDQVENQFGKNVFYNDKKRNLDKTHQTQIPSKSHLPLSEKEKNKENSSNMFKTASEMINNDHNIQGLTTDKKFEVVKNDGKNDEMSKNESAKEFEVENEYPRNKWILQHPETRKRPGPPTKRGKRDVTHVVNKQKELIGDNDTVHDEIEENFEEISDNEELNEVDDVSLKSEQEKVKIRPLFPSVSDSIANTTMIFPSMENNNTIPIDEILFKPGRFTRPKNVVIIIRGPPGSGKSHVAKLIKDKEIEMGGPTPRLLSIDDYFMIENDYVEKCPKSGRKIPKKEILYEYEKEMEDTYMQYLIKSFKKTVSDHLFDFIIVDCCNQSLRTFNEFYNAARDGNFSPFIVDMKCDIEKCLNQNIHNRSEDDIRNIIKNYQDCPGHYIKLDISNLLDNVVEMEDVSDLEDNLATDSEVNKPEEDDEPEDINPGGFLKSKWDTDPTTENLARLDGTSKPISKRGTSSLEEYLQIDGWEPPLSSTNGKKRVRWADIEEKRAQEKMRAIGFVVGQTDWSRMMDPTSGSGALTKTKYIERLNRRR